MLRKNSILIPVLSLLAVMVILLVIMVFFRPVESVMLILLSAVMLVAIIAALFFIFGVLMPLKALRDKLNAMAKAEIADCEFSGYFAEFRRIAESLGVYRQRIDEIVRVVNHLSEGKVDDDFRAFGEHDELGYAILRLKESIITSKQVAMERRMQDEQQNWASHGLAKFGAMFRDFENNVEAVSTLFIRDLVQYLEMEVGGFFLSVLVDQEVQELKLAGAYAFDREKKLERSFRPGEGLVGRCVLEKDTIVITDVPENYIRIRSGLGEDKPSTILLIPVMFDDQVLGVIELAGFSSVEKYKITFLENLGRNIASMIAKTVD